MNTSAARTLLPNGLHDDLPPNAEFDARLIGRLMKSFAGSGYQRVKPPLVEFEDTLVEGPGAAVAAEMFRMVDPASQRMLCVRSDITPQIARIAGSRLARAPRPLRLSYAGEILRVRGTQLRPERQFAQAGIELIGESSLAADVEVVTLAVEALSGLGIADLSVDLTLPALVPIVCNSLGLDEEQGLMVRRALDNKDVVALGEVSERGRGLLAAILAAAGPAHETLKRLQSLGLPPRAHELIHVLAELVGQVRIAVPDLALTIDLGEFRGVEYHTGIAFTVFARGARGELCGGGRYELSTGEPATGFTVYMEGLGRVVPTEPDLPRLFAPCGTAPDEKRRLRDEGWRIVAGLSTAANARGEARRLGCTHILKDGQPQPLSE